MTVYTITTVYRSGNASIHPFFLIDSAETSFAKTQEVAADILRYQSLHSFVEQDGKLVQTHIQTFAPNRPQEKYDIAMLDLRLDISEARQGLVWARLANLI